MKALLLIDFQNDFGGFGTLAQPNAAAILEATPLFLEKEKFALVIASQNWMPATHPIFAANHFFRYPKQLVPINGKEERLWPIYGVQESFGADWMAGFPVQQMDRVLQKGLEEKALPYSCFSPATNFDLQAYLQEQGIKELVLGGFLTEFAVAHTALDALELGYAVTVVKELCGAANLDGEEDGVIALKKLEKAGVQLK